MAAISRKRTGNCTQGFRHAFQERGTIQRGAVWCTAIPQHSANIAPGREVCSTSSRALFRQRAVQAVTIVAEGQFRHCARDGSREYRRP